MRAIELEHFEIVKHSYSATFSIKTNFYETNNLFSFQKLNRFIPKY